MRMKVLGRCAVEGSALFAVLILAGCGSSSPMSGNGTAAPLLSPGGGTYNAAQTVTITDTTPGAVLYCTTDGTTPTPSSPQCSQPTTVFKTEFLQAIAVAPGKSASAAVSAGYTIDLSAAPVPAFSPAGGTFTATQTVTIADSVPGANIYYTTDGSLPTASSSQYTAPLSISSTETLSAIAVASGYNNSGVASAVYVLTPPVAVPTFSVAQGTYSTVQQVGIGDATPGATIYYTTNGTTPTTASTVYSGPIAVAQAETINAIAAASGYANSAVASATYAIEFATAAPPSFSLSLATLTISDTTAGAAIYYTTNGTTPTTASTLYTGPITVTNGEVINAIAAGPNLNTSADASQTINFGPAPTPTYSLRLAALTISDSSTGVTIYYTTDGSAATTASAIYTGPITVTNGEVINAIAAATGFLNSVDAPYTVTLSATPAPTFTPASGATSTTTLPVTIADPGATIYYTTDGSTPTTSSTLYTGPITLSSPGTETISAIGAAAGFANSSVATATYSITAGNSSLSGAVLSGASPVNAATVQLYAAGQAGYGSAPTALLTEPVSTSASGGFSFTYNCPASPGDLVYLVATGGDPGPGINPALVLMTALGPCGSLAATTGIVINEATTVASAYALAQFMTTAPNVGSSATNYVGLTHAFAAVNNLVGITTGAALAITPAYATNTVAYLNSSTVPQARINTLADVVNACAGSNGGGTGCPGLFSAATPPAGSAPADTLQATLNIAQNPGSNVSTLYALASPSGPFTPELGTAPNDWTLALTFTGAGLGIAPGATVTYSNQGSIFTGVAAIIDTGLAVDATGNIWVIAYGDDNPSAPSFSDSFGALLAEFDNLGAPQTPTRTLGTAAPAVASVGGFNPEPSVTPDALVSIAIDQTGNLWLGDTADGNLLEVSPSLSVLLPANPVLNQGIYSIALDNSGNVWTGGGVLSEFTNTGAPVPAVSNADGQVAGVGPLYARLTDLLFDSNGFLWGADTLRSLGNDAYLISTSDGSVAYDPYPAAGSYNFLTLAADGVGNVYGCADASGQAGVQTLDILNAAAEASAPTTYTPTVISIASGRGCGNQLLLDGLGHLFAVTNGTFFPAGTAIDEFTASGALISPAANGYTGTSAAEAPTLNPDPNLFAYVPGPSAAIDGSGNLWVLNSDTNGASSPGNVLVEFVGIAAPVVTPTSVALKNGGLGVRP